MNLTATIGDTVNFSIPLRWRTGAFVPGNDWTLLLTVKSAPDTQLDAAASFQKAYPSGGITVSGTNALIEVLPEDTVDMTAGTYYWDIQASNDDGAVRTVGNGTLVLTRDVTRETEATLDVVTVSPPLLYFSYQAYLSDTDDDPVMTEAEWVAAIAGRFRYSETAPEDPNTGDGWFDPSTGIYSMWNGNAWVVVSGLGSESGALTDEDITELLQGAEADPTRIGEEYLPEQLTLDGLVLGDTSADVLPSGTLGGTGTNGQIAVHNNSDAGGIRYALDRNTISGIAVATSAEIQAGNVLKEVGRFRIEPSEIAAKIGGWYLLSGTVIVQSYTDSSLASPPYVGIHLGSSTSTSITRGLTTALAAGASGFYSTKLEMFVPVLFFDRTNSFQLRADETKLAIHAWETNYDSATLGSMNTITFSENTAGIANEALKANAAEIILTLRVVQDATFTGEVIMTANNVRFTPMS